MWLKFRILDFSTKPKCIPLILFYRALDKKTKYLGTTPPISLDEPTDEELKETSDLITCLKSEGLFESVEEGKKRYTPIIKPNKYI